MRYAILLLLVIVGAFAVVGGFGGEEESPHGSKKPTRGDENPESTTPLSARAFDERFKERPSSGSAPFDEPIADEIYRMIKDLVAGRVTDADRADLQERLVTAMEEAELGNAVLRDKASQAAVDDLLRNSSLYMPEDGRVSAEFLLRQDEIISSVASSFAARLVRKVPGLEIAGVHTGSFLSPVLDVKLPEGHERAAWAQLSGFEYEEHTPIPEANKAMNGRKVGLTGYMITLGETENIEEFLLVESLWTCCFGVAPDVHQVVVVRKKGKGVEFSQQPLLVLGTLEVGEETEDGFVTSLYRIHATSVREIK